MTNNRINLVQILKHLLMFVYFFGTITFSADEIELKKGSLPLEPEEYDSYENNLRSNFINQTLSDTFSKTKSNLTVFTTRPTAKLKLTSSILHEDIKHMRYRHHHNEIGIKRKKLRSVDEFPISNHHPRTTSPFLHWVSYNN